MLYFGFLLGSVLLILLVNLCCLLCVFTVWVPCCDVGYDFCKNTKFGSSYHQLFIGRSMTYWRYLCLFVHSGVRPCCDVFVFLVLLFWCFFVLCTLCYQFLWIVHFWLSLRYSLTFRSLLRCSTILLSDAIIMTIKLTTLIELILLTLTSKADKQFTF